MKFLKGFFKSNENRPLAFWIALTIVSVFAIITAISLLVILYALVISDPWFVLTILGIGVFIWSIIYLQLNPVNLNKDDD